MMRITKINASKDVKGKKRVAAYARVSTGAEEQLLSLETQKAHYEAWIKGNSDWEYAGLYYDEGISGTKKENRPALMQMIADCEHGLIDFIIAKSISRFARNTTDCLELVRKLNDLGIPILFEKENINTETMESELLLSIMSSLAESESVSISENNKWGIQRRFENGTFKCSYPPFGYDWDKEKGEMVVNVKQADTVKYIFAETLKGVGTADIARKLTEWGVPTKKGGSWTGHTVNGIIRNERYIGDCLFQKTYTDSQFNRRNNFGERNQYYVENHHEAIISREDYKAANAVVDRRRNEKGIIAQSSKYLNRYPLSGKVICGECGGKFKRKKYANKVILSCTNHIDDIRSCTMKSIELTDVERAFITIMNKLIFSQKKILKPFFKGLQENNQADVLLEIHRLEDEYNSITEKKQTLKTLFAQGILEPAIFMQENDVLIADAESVLSRKDTLSYQARFDMAHIEETCRLLSFVEKGSMLSTFDGEIFENYVESIVVKNRNELEFHLKCGLKLSERI